MLNDVVLYAALSFTRVKGKAVCPLFTADQDALVTEAESP